MNRATPAVDVVVPNADDQEPDPDESGQGMVEYALILVLIAVVVIVVLQIVGQQVANVFSNVSNGLGQ